MRNKVRDDEFLDTIENYTSIIYKVCLAYASSVEDFEDLRQDVLLNLWRGWDSFRGDSKLSTWIYKVSLNTCLSQINQRRKHGVNIPLDQLAVAVYTGDSRANDLKELYKLIGMLTASDKALIMLWLDDYSYEEIAEMSGLRRNTVAVRLKRIKEKLIKLSNQ